MLSSEKIESLLEEEMTNILGGQADENGDIVCHCTSGAHAIKSNEVAEN